MGNTKRDAGEERTGRKDRLNRYYQKSRAAAEEILEDPEAVQGKVAGIETKMEKVKRGPLKAVWDDLRLMVSLVKDFAAKRYTKIPVKALVSVFGGLLYFLSPLDAIPDVLVGIGFVDDAAVLGFVIKGIHDELEKYAVWKANAAAVEGHGSAGDDSAGTPAGKRAEDSGAMGLEE